MLEAHIKQVEPETVAYLTMHGEYDQTPQGFDVLYGWVGRHGLQPSGPPSAVYLTPPGEGDRSWELWAPVVDTGDLEPDAAGVGIKHVPGRTVAWTMHQGPYETIETTYSALMEWVGGQGYSLSGPPEELYFSDPNEVPPAEYLTEIRFPVASAQ